MLRGMRALKGMSQQELAERAGLSENAISSFERAERFPRATTIDALAVALGTDSDALIGDLLLRDRGGSPYVAGPRESALRELTELLLDKPEGTVRLVLAVARLIVDELSGSEQRLARDREDYAPNPAPSSRRDK